jgi:hypothetical protein
LAYGATCILGLLSHASFIYALAGGIVWMPVALLRKGLRPPRLITDFSLLFLVPILFVAWLYTTAIRGMTIGGGPHTTFPHFLADTVASSFGLPSGWLSAWIGVAIIVVMATAGAVILRRGGSDEWVFLLTAGLIAPAIVLCLRHEQLYPRYVFVALPFLVLLAAAALTGLSSLVRFGPIAAAVVLLAFITGNMLHIFRFLAIGRGHYRDAIEYIATHTPGKVAMVGSDSEMRTAMLLGFYAPRISAAGRQFEYVPDDSPVPPDWYLFTQQPDDPPVEQLIAPQWHANYQLEAQFPHYGLSGWDWWLFRRVGASEVTP